MAALQASRPCRCKGKLLPFPSIWIRSGNFWAGVFSEEMSEFLKSEVSRSTYSEPPAQLQGSSRIPGWGKTLRSFFRHYTEKQWGRAPEKTIPRCGKKDSYPFDHDDGIFPTPSRAYPAKGFTEMIRRMLDHPNIEVCLNRDFL